MEYFVPYKKANGDRECHSVLKSRFVFWKKDSHTGVKNHEGEHMTTKCTFPVNYTIPYYWQDLTRWHQ